MPPSRRQLLRSSALSLSMLSGCAMTDGLHSAELSETTQSLNTSETEETTASTEKPPSLPCGPGPLPDSGWPLPDRSPGRANYAPDASGPTTKPSVEWSVPIPSSEEYPVIEFTRPMVADGRVYVGRAVDSGTMRDGPDTQYVYAYDVETGEQVWRATIPQRPGTLIATGNMVLVPPEPYENSTLYAFDAETGESKWARSLPTPINRVLPTPDGILVTSRYDNTGTRSYDTDGHLNWHIEKYASDITWANGIVYGVSDGHLVAIETANGTVAWTRQLHSRTTYNPLLATSCAVFVATEGVLQAVRRDGAPVWSVDAEIREMATDGERIYAVDGSDRLRCFGMADGKQRWKRFIGEEKGETHAFYGKLVVDGQTVYAGTSNGRLLALSKDDGSERWRLGEDTVNGEKICLVGDTLYGVSEYGEYDDSLLAFR